MKEESFYLNHEKKLREYEKSIAHFKQQNEGDPLFNGEILKLEKKFNQLRVETYKDLSPWDRVCICRHSMRPHSEDYLQNIFDSFTEIHGDRTFSDDKALIAGFARIENQKFIVVGQEKGSDTESRLYRNFGMMNPEGFRKALRAFRLAEKFNLPIISFLDTAGAYPGVGAEERGQGWAIAQNLKDMFGIKVPIMIIVIGEGSSGGALGVGIGDSIAMLEHSYYSVISPEGCASILWKDTSRNRDAAKALKLNSNDLLQLDIIDQVIPEPLGGAHHDPKECYKNVKNHILEQIGHLKLIHSEDLIKRRYDRFRRIGKFERIPLK